MLWCSRGGGNRVKRSAHVPLPRAKQTFDFRCAGWGSQHPSPCGQRMVSKLMQLSVTAATHLLGFCKHAASSRLTGSCRAPHLGLPAVVAHGEGIANCLATRTVSMRLKDQSRRLALQTAGLLSTCLSHCVQVAMACVGPLDPVLLCADDYDFRGPPVSLGRLQSRASCCCVAPVQGAKASAALSAQTGELAAKAAEMEALQQRFNEEHAELSNLQANEDEVRVGGRACSAAPQQIAAGKSQ